MKIINQSGTAIYNADNLLCIKVSETCIKVMPNMSIWHDTEERIPQIVIAKYDSHEQAKAEFEKLIGRMRVGGCVCYQMPER